VATFRAILEKSAAENAVDPTFLPNAIRHLEDMDRYCRGALCRHRALVQYFGQAYPAESCNACDLCLGDTEEVPEAAVVAQKILSCVARVKENFGINHVVAVLRGDDTDGVRKWQHGQLSTYGLLKAHSKADVRDWIYQLLGQGLLRQAGDDYPVLKLNEASWEVMRGKRSVRLVRLARRKKGERPQKSKADAVSWEGVDRELFEALRRLRRTIAGELGKPPYVIFGDATLRELARVRPATPERMRGVYGVGDAKLRDFGERFLAVIKAHGPSSPAAGSPPNTSVSAFALYRQGKSVEEVTLRLNLPRGTAMDYLADFLSKERPASLAAWVADDVRQRVRAAVRVLNTRRPEPLYRFLGGEVSHDEIRLVLAFDRAGGLEP
jgi:ATP-dependent DNA helicase RecQ